MKDTYIKGVAAATGGGSVGAKLMKTNQTTSYRTGDDGDLQEGRLNSFFVLNSNNVFGTNERFTDDIGTQAYTNNIVIDHSTDNGTEILGIHRATSAGNVSWDTAIDDSLSLSVGGFSTWRLWNINEHNNFANWGNISNLFGYAPLSFPLLSCWTSTGNAANAVRNGYTGTVSIGLLSKTGAQKRVSVRNFTYSDLGVTGAINPIVGLLPLKTGQTTSYRTGDDGDLQEGRDVDFYTLPSNNPFGNTDRFSDELGGSVYASGILLDWSTFDGTNVIGWRITSNGVAITWDSAIDEALSLSIGGFSSGWRLPNNNESTMLYNTVTTRHLNYAPFNNTTNNRYWTGTVPGSITSYAYVLVNRPTDISGWPRTGVQEYYPCRTFTVTGTTLT